MSPALLVLLTTAFLALPAPVGAASDRGDLEDRRAKVRWDCKFIAELMLDEGPPEGNGPRLPLPGVPWSLVGALRIRNLTYDSEWYHKHPRESCLPVPPARYWPNWLRSIRVDLYKVVPGQPDERLRTFSGDPFHWADGSWSLNEKTFRTRSYCAEDEDEVGTQYYVKTRIKRKGAPNLLVIRSGNLRIEKPWDCPPFEEA